MNTNPGPARRFLEAVRPFGEVVLATHINPDPDAIASMLGLSRLIAADQPGKSVALTLDGIIARAENQAMARNLQLDLRPIESIAFTPTTALILVDTQPHTGRRFSESVTPVAVLDHHETPGRLEGVPFLDIRPELGATTTIVVEYLAELPVALDAPLATALFYGIDTELSGYPREAGPSDDLALAQLYPLVDHDLLARIRHPKLPQSYFATFQHALWNAFLYRDVIISYCGIVPQPDIIAELADFFVRFDQVAWALCLGIFEGQVRISLRADHLGCQGGEVLRAVVEGMGVAGGHDRRAGGAVPLQGDTPQAIDRLIRKIGRRFLDCVDRDEHAGRRLLDAAPVHPVP